MRFMRLHEEEGKAVSNWKLETTLENQSQILSKRNNNNQLTPTA